MDKIEISSFAKINLSLDVLGVMENGFHQVEMVMQQILLCDDVSVKWEPDSSAEGISIRLSTNRYFLPVDERNLAWKAAALMSERYGAGRKGRFSIDIKKRIPVSAGLAGGSGNGAAILHAVNRLWGLDLSVKELSAAGAELGSGRSFLHHGTGRRRPHAQTFFRTRSSGMSLRAGFRHGNDARAHKEGTQEPSRPFKAAA